MNLPWTPELNAVDKKKRDALEQALVENKGRVSLTAEALKVPRETIRRWLKKYDLGARAIELRLAGGAGIVGRPRKVKA